MCIRALNDVEDLGCVEEGRQEEALALDGVAGRGHAYALELLLHLGGALDVPVLADAGLALDPAGWLHGLQALEAAVRPPPLLLHHALLPPEGALRHLLDLREAGAEEEEGQAEAEEQGRATHFSLRERNN